MYDGDDTGRISAFGYLAGTLSGEAKIGYCSATAFYNGEILPSENIFEDLEGQKGSYGENIQLHML